MRPQKELDRKRFAERLKEARGKMTKKSLAEMCGVSENTYGKWENGDGGLSLFNAFRIAVECGVSLDWLVGLADDRRMALNSETVQEISFKTYGDVFRILEQLKQLSTIRVEASIKEVSDYGSKRVNGMLTRGEVARKAYCLTIRNKKTVEAQETIEKIEGLRKPSQEAMEEIGKMALDKFLEILDSKPLPERVITYDDELFGFDDENSPF